jgi:hypothetical protein
MPPPARRNEFSQVDRRTPPLATSASNRSALFRNAEATVRLVPTGVLSSWATPATSLPSAASFSVCTRLSCAVRRSSSDCDNCLCVPDLGEQPRVLDGDDRLTGEGFQELDLRLGK